MPWALEERYVLEVTPDERQFWFWQVVGIASVAAGVALCGYILWMIFVG